MSVLDWSLLLVAGAISALLLWPRVLRVHIWRATVTPLASIIGSGFLVVAPLLAEVAGPQATWAMVAIVLLAFAVGGVIRFNIRHVEAVENSATAPWSIRTLGTVSDVSLAVAYVVSIAFYIRLMAAFLLERTPYAGDFQANLVSTIVLCAVAAVGWVRGLRGLEAVESIAVSIKLSILAALLLALAWFDHGLAAVPGLAPSELDGLTRLRMLGGLLLIVQGFETSRYLGLAYSPKMRSRSMLYAQIVSAVIYVGFIYLVSPLLSQLQGQPPSETAIIGLSGQVAFVLPFMLILAAFLSQLSAAVADTVGAGGLIGELARHRFRERRTYPLLIACSIALIWLFNIFEVIAFASRAFAFYYMIQALLAALATRHVHDKFRRRMTETGFLALALLLAAITIFAMPAE